MKPLRSFPETCLPLALASSLWLCLATGCVVPNALTPDKAYWAKLTPAKGATYSTGGTIYGSDTNPPVVINATNLASYFPATETNGNTRVSYGPGFQAQAALLAGLTERAVTQAKEEVGWSTPVKPHFYLLHLLNEGRTINYSLRWDDPQSALFLLAQQNTNAGSGESPARDLSADESLLKDAPLLVLTAMHELCELGLVSGNGIMALPDVTAHWSCFHFHKEYRYHTRWFREGYANYAGYHAANALRALVAQMRPGLDTLPPGAAYSRPFTKLAKVKGDLFTWNQSSKADLNTDNYMAALGLFLLIEQRQGAEAIRTVIRELPPLERPDGPAILELFRTKTGLDLKQMVRDFAFPDFGLTLRNTASWRIEVEAVQTNSAANQAGLCVGDLIQEINGQRLETLLDYEVRVLQALDAGADLRLTVLRQGQTLILILVRGKGCLGACGLGAQPDLPAQFPTRNGAVAAVSSFNLQPSAFLRAPGWPPGFPEPETLVTEDCLRPGNS